MNQHSEDLTQRYYEDKAEEYLARTSHLDMESLYKPFLELMPSGRTILDAGCGPGRDTLSFLKKGFHVTAFDASAKMVELVSKQTGVVAFQMRFQELNYEQEFDGIWACASLLHVPFCELEDVLTRFHRALKTGGICFMSFKQGNGERFDDGRRFIDFTEATLRQKLADISGVSILRIWGTEDQAGRVGVKWVNALIRAGM
jgi:2-polyprenyl-3-methyl-5-hydroxy-6-metoxy-1,4-benzoquinol methylase